MPMLILHDFFLFLSMVTHLVLKATTLPKLQCEGYHSFELFMVYFFCGTFCYKIIFLLVSHFKSHFNLLFKIVRLILDSLLYLRACVGFVV